MLAENSPDSHKPVKNRQFAALQRSLAGWHVRVQPGTGRPLTGR